MCEANAVLSNAVAMFKKSVCILYVDAGWVLMLAVFVDSNHHVQLDNHSLRRCLCVCK